jgi:enamine deaminase RidA (YjgF/YER057c/UK114 family)
MPAAMPAAMLSRLPAACEPQVKSFAGDDGAEHHFAVAAPPDLDLAGQIGFVAERYADAVKQFGLGPETAVFRRVFVSDVLNQDAVVQASALAEGGEGGPVAVSVIQQPPLPGAKIALIAYHADGPGAVTKTRLAQKHVLVQKNGLGHLWSTRLCAGAQDGSTTSAEQTRDVFGQLVDTLGAQGANLRDHCVRTWLYLKDVDVFYQGMVDSRRELFAQHGLGRDTHYIASTGIEGACAHRHDLVAMDAYSVVGLDPRQVSYLNDFGRLCRTDSYAVTFERGTRVGYADRAHLFISGTASIDREGKVLHLGDVLRQLDRAIENVEALLRSGGAHLGDLMHLLVYLRDPADYARVEEHLEMRLSGVPRLIVQGAVCRPEWLVEVEGIAIAAQRAPDLPRF